MQSVSISRSSSKNWSGVSRSSSSSFVGAQESRDDIESYLSMFKGREGKREAGHAVDWGKLLDGREVLESMEGLQGRVREEGEQEGVEEDYYEEAASMFLKPNPKYLPSPKHPQEKYADTRYCDGAESRKTVHNHMESHAHHSSRRGLGVNVTTISSHLNTYLDLEPGEENISTSTASSIEHKSLHENGKQFEGLVPKTAQNSDGRLLESTHSDESVRVGVRKSGSAATTSQCSRQSIELSSTQSVSGESESESSLSGIFKNNIFSLDQLEAPVQPSVSELSPSNTSTNSATEEEDNNWGSHLPYKLCSPTELESPTVGRNARGGQEGADDDEKTEVRAVVTGTSQEHRPGAHESDRESSSSEDNDRPRETDPKSEDDSEVLSYEEDFESSTVTESDQESGTDISSASGAQEERGETTSGEKSTEEFGDHESSTHEREQERHSVAQQAASGAAEHVTASSEASDVGGGAEIATHREVCREHDDKSGLHKGRAKHSEASKQEGREQTPLLSRMVPEDVAAQVDSCVRPDVPTSLLSLPECDHLHPSPLPPPIIPTDPSAFSLASETLQDLLSAQLALTKHFITRSRSLAEQISASLTPNYHYTTLEETKRYISENRPKVLTCEEAQKIVSQEDSH